MTKWRAIADDLAGRIRSGEYPPGALLPSIRSLMESWTASNKTVEHALAHLVGEGLVESEPQRGYRVTGVDGGTVAARVSDHEQRIARIERHLGLEAGA